MSLAPAFRLPPTAFRGQQAVPQLARSLRARASRTGPILDGGFLRAVAADIVLIVTALVVTWLAVGAHLAAQSRFAAAGARSEIDNLAMAAAESTAQAIENIDQSLRFIRQAYEADPEHFDIARWAAQATSPAGMAFQFSFIDRDGMMADGTLGAGERPTSLADRPHFRFHLSNPKDALYISKPMLGRVSMRNTIQFTRKVAGPGGRFDGVVVISVDPEWLTRLDGELALGRGSMFLLGDDGIVRSGDQHSIIDHLVGRDLSASPLAARIVHESHGDFRSDGFVDHVDRLYAFKRIAGYNLAVVVGKDATEVFAAFNDYRWHYLVAGTLLSAIAVLLGAVDARGRFRLMRSQRTLSIAVANISQGLILADGDKRVSVINRRAMELLDLPHGAGGEVASLDHIMRWKDDPSRFGSVSDDTCTEDGCYREIVRHDGVVLELREHGLPDGGAVMTFTDVTQRKENEERARHLASHDALTGLPNRIYLNAAIARTLRRTPPQNAPAAILALDLDGFKSVNDTYGHDAGDLLLRKVAERLREAIRDGDTVARIGGDEFVIIQPSAGQPEGATALSQRIIEMLSQPFDLGEHQACIGTSIGIAIYPDDGEDADTLFKNADMALYRAKREGRRTYRLYDPAMDRQSLASSSLEQDLRLAVGTDQMFLHYQPVFSAETGRVECVEALARWTNPTRGPVAPEQFVPLAEKSGLIEAFGRWVLETACREAASWAHPCRVAVNVSAVQMRRRELPAMVADILVRTGLPANALKSR